MGWWGYDILSGDEPLDLLSIITDRIGIQPDTKRWASLDLYPSGTIDNPDKRNLVAAWFTNHNINHLATVVDDLSDSDERAALVWQVLAVVAMAAGAPVSEPLRARFIAAGNADQWASEDPARKDAIDRYIATVRDYDGTPTALRSATLGDLLNIFPPA